MTLAQTALDAVTVGRWQFGITTVYHFVLVPLTIGLSLLVAIMQTAWHRTGKEYLAAKQPASLANSSSSTSPSASPPASSRSSSSA